MGEPYGLKFSGYDLLPNSRKAILLGEYIKLNHPEHEEAYREAVFRSYSTESQDIGKEEVLSNILQEFGLKPEMHPWHLTIRRQRTNVKKCPICRGN